MTSASSVEVSKSRAKLSPHQRIMRAAKAGRGLRFSADEVALLSFDDAIATRAENENEGLDDHPPGCKCGGCANDGGIDNGSPHVSGCACRKCNPNYGAR